MPMLSDCSIYCKYYMTLLEYFKMQGLFGCYTPPLAVRRCETELQNLRVLGNLKNNNNNEENPKTSEPRDLQNWQVGQVGKR